MHEYFIAPLFLDLLLQHSFEIGFMYYALLFITHDQFVTSTSLALVRIHVYKQMDKER
jgi:hypothetical protein